MTVTTERTVVSLPEALDFNPRWDIADQMLLRLFIERIPGATIYQPPKEHYLGVLDENGNHVMYIYSGYVQWTNSGYAPPNAVRHGEGKHLWPFTTCGLVLRY